ncbi:DUF2939 domain-containing protein [Acidomonas methanolica]|nr:DUF2939 domain-containing protein [Acidomonas methanolica]MBU2654282.1 DUF2939 domain-containing protein [Acidomonas methanolica]
MRRLARLRLLPAAGLGLAGRAMPGSYTPRSSHLMLAGAVAVLATYLLSPFLALWTINGAVRTHDAHLLSTHIDWSALNTNLKQQTIDAILGPPPEADDLPDFGSAFATTAISHAIDTRLTPSALLGMATQLMPKDGEPIGWATLFTRFSARFEGVTRFKAEVDAPDGRTQAIVHLKFEHWHWQVTRVDLPGVA